MTSTENQGIHVGDKIPAKFRNIPPPIPSNDEEAATEATEDEAKVIASALLDTVYTSVAGEEEGGPA